MIYLSPNSTTINGGGRLYSPANGAISIQSGVWAADNAQFTGYVSPSDYIKWLWRVAPAASRCLFATAPDVVADAVATLDRFRFYGWRIRAMGFPVALVAQDGLEDLRWPPEFDALFIGGSTDWKMGPAALWCIKRARDRGAWVHVGRVNSQKRIRHFQLAGVNSVDGTAIAFAPDKRRRQLTDALIQSPLGVFDDLCSDVS